MATPDTDGTPPAHTSLDEARRRRDEAHQLVAPLQAQVKELAAAELQAARDGSAAEARKLKLARAAAERELQLAAADEQAARSQLAAELEKWLGPDPTDDVQRLSGQQPVALLPVRLETRFAPGEVGGELLVRVIPDEIFADAHEPELTAAEAALGGTYWAASVVTRREAWRRLLLSTPATRAAWIVQATDPAGPAALPRASSWTRAVEARLLPDRWIALAFRGDVEVGRAVGRPIAEPLALTLSPSGGGATDVSSDGLVLDEALAWTVDLALAEEKGMALRLRLKPQDWAAGIDELLVLGVKASLAPEQAGAALADLLDAHRFTDGVALVSQGAPTSNTSASPAAFPPDDADGSRSHELERVGLEVVGRDGGALATALGVEAARFAHLDGASGREQERARAMADALWPLTLGYFLEQIMDPVFDSQAIEDARRYFVANVRGRGPLPALRIGARPYGVLPATSLESWRPDPEAKGAAAALPDGLRQLAKLWREASTRAPHLGRSNDAGRDLIEALGLDASSREVRLRSATGADFVLNLVDLLGLGRDLVQQVQRAIAAVPLALIGHADWQPRLLDVTFSSAAPLFAGPLVAPEPLSEQAGLAWDYVRWIGREASLDDLKHERLPDGVTRPTALLYELLRVAVLQEFAGTALDVLGRHDQTPPDRREHELVDIVAGVKRPTIWQRFDQPLPAVSGQASLGEYLTQLATQPGSGRLWSYRQSLRALEGLPTAELQRLLAETLDLCSHRLDAWMTSLATARLDEMRRAQPQGVHLGAYGWVEGLRPAAGTGLAGDALDTGGYVHAPSMTHAATGAVLRSAYLTHVDDADPRFDLDLSSARVRVACSLLDAVRQEQPLGAVLGVRFERALHDRALDRHIDPFRRLFPLVGGKATGSGDDGGAQAALDRNVVDGLALRTAFLGGDRALQNALAASGSDRDALDAELRALDDASAAVADLLLAESVFQAVRGTHAGAAASLDALAQGVRPPTPELVRQPRGGIHVIHRAALLLGGSAPSAPAWASIAPTPRALAEPALDGWVGSLLGDPAAVRCRVTYAAATERQPELRGELSVTLDQLGLRALDVLALAQPAERAQASELDQRVAAAALQARPGATDLRILYDADPAWDRALVRSFSELLELCSALQAVVGGARPLQPADLLAADERDASVGASWMAEEALARARAAEIASGNTTAPTSIGDLKSMLDAAVRAAQVALAADSTADLAALRTALRRAALFGVPGAWPTVPLALATTPPRDATARALARQAAADLAADPAKRARADRAAQQQAASNLVAQGLAAQAEVNRRVAAAAAVTTGGSPSEQVTAATSKLEAIFGRGFRFLPRVMPPAAAELAQALAAAPALVAEDPRAPYKLLRQAALVREPLARWRRLSLYMTALGTPPSPPVVVQLPAIPGERWVGLPFADGPRATSGRTSLLLHRIAAPAADAPWVGLMLDDWTDVIPAIAEQTGLAFHHLSPHARAPNVVLLAVPPVLAPTWDLDSLVAVLRETLALAKMRAVDLDLLGELGQLLPASFVAANTRDETIGTRFAGMMAADAVVQLDPGMARDPNAEPDRGEVS